jgi:hypothetical protein
MSRKIVYIYMTGRLIAIDWARSASLALMHRRSVTPFAIAQFVKPSPETRDLEVGAVGSPGSGLANCPLVIDPAPTIDRIPLASY